MAKNIKDIQPPKNTQDIVGALNQHILVEGTHVEFKIYYASIKLDQIIRDMVAMANTGGGVIVIGIGDSGKGSYIIHGLPNGADIQLGRNLQTFIRTRTINLDNWRLDIFKYLEMDLAAIFVGPSTNGVCFIHSETDLANRTYYYRQGDININIRSQFRTIYKYMNLDAAIASFETKTWRFCEPTQWQDKFESRFYCANYSKVPCNPGSEQRVYATCVTRTKNSEAAWKVYAGKEGIQNHCIQIEIDLAAFFQQLLSSGFRIYERKVEYADEEMIIHLHESRSKKHAQYFNTFDFYQFLNLLALKRDAYTYENEVRYFAIPQKPEERSLGKKACHTDIKMDWSKVIKKVRVDKKCSISELVALRHSLWSCEINPIIKGISLPGDLHPKASSMKQVDLILFNIDDMPGRKHIIIEP